MGPLTLLLMVQVAQAVAAPAATVTQVAIFTVTPSRDIDLPWTCKGTPADDAVALLQVCPTIVSDKTATYTVWSAEDFEKGLPCSFALSVDTKRSVVLAMVTGVDKSRVEYFVLFFEGKRLRKAQMIRGPWDLHLAKGFPPVFEQTAEGDAGFLYEYDRKSGLYTERPYPYAPGYEDTE